MGRLILIFLMAATPVLAQQPMTGPAFETYTQGRTLTFGLPNNSIHGVEQYLPDQRVIWSTEPGQCTDGVWYAEGTNICFIYDGDPEHKCWEIYRTDSGIRAEFQNRPGSSVLFEAVDNPTPLICNNLLF